MIEVERIEDMMSKGRRILEITVGPCSKTCIEDLRALNEIVENLLNDFFLKHLQISSNVFNKGLNESIDIGRSTIDLERADDNESKVLSLEECLIQRDYLIELLIRLYKIMKSTHTTQWSKYYSADKDIFSARTHSRLLEISFLVLKAPIDDLDRQANRRCRLAAKTSICRLHLRGLTGMKHYFREMFPIVDWSLTGCRISIYGFLKKFDRLLARIIKNQNIRLKMDWSTIQAVVDGLNLFFIEQKPFVLSGYVSSIATELMKMLRDSYPPVTGRGIQEALLTNQLATYKSNQINSPNTVKDSIAKFMSIVVALKAPDLMNNNLFYSNQKDMFDPTLFYGVIPLIINTRMLKLINDPNKIDSKFISKDIYEINEIILRILNQSKVQIYSLVYINISNFELVNSVSQIDGDFSTKPSIPSAVTSMASMGYSSGYYQMSLRNNRQETENRIKQSFFTLKIFLRCFGDSINDLKHIENIILSLHQKDITNGIHEIGNLLKIGLSCRLKLKYQMVKLFFPSDLDDDKMLQIKSLALNNIKNHEISRTSLASYMDVMLVEHEFQCELMLNGYSGFDQKKSKDNREDAKTRKSVRDKTFRLVKTPNIVNLRQALPGLSRSTSRREERRDRSELGKRISTASASLPPIEAEETRVKTRSTMDIAQDNPVPSSSGSITKCQKIKETAYSLRKRVSDSSDEYRRYHSFNS